MISMIRSFVGAGALVAAVLLMPHAAAAEARSGLAAQARSQVTPAAAAPFLGDWTLSLQGPNGPGTFQLLVKADEKEKVVGEISVETMPTQVITDVSLDKGTLVLGYTFFYDGNPVDAFVSLTPGTDGTVAASIDFASGAYLMTGTARKKEAAKGEAR